jgi:hypothetical protein
MEHLSEHIESSIVTLLEGLDLDIQIDYRIQNDSEYKNFIGSHINIELKTRAKLKGKIKNVEDKEFTITYFVVNGKERTLTEKTIKFTSVKTARVFDEESSILEPDKMKQIIGSKISSFKSITTILNRWASSPNAPSKDKVRYYMDKIVESGEKALQFLYKALSHDIDYDSIEIHKIQNAAAAKPLILDAIYDLDSNIKEIKEKLLSDDMTLVEREFRLGYPERFAKGEFFPIGNYFKDWYDAPTDSVKICPFGTSGQSIVLEDLRIILPKKPRNKKEILFSDFPKKEQYWRRPEIPDTITPDNQDQWDDFIKEEFRRRREGIWFMNNGEAVYLTGNHYYALTHCKMLDTGGYMDYREAQRDIFYHVQACIVDDRCLGQLFVKSRRTGFTYIILCCFANDSTGMRNKNFGITSKSDDDAKKAFIKFRYMLLNLPFYFIPLIKGKVDSPKEFEFGAPMSNSRATKKSKTFVLDDYLNNLIDYEPTKNDSYDGQALFRYLGDEAGKWKKPMDYIQHFGQISPTMNQGGRIVGKSFIGSTVGAMNQGGSQFKEMWNSSDVKQRDPVTRMTGSGLYRFFLAAQKNMEEFTDKYGKCHEIVPDVPTYNVAGKLIRVGAIHYLESQEGMKKKISDKSLNEQYRAYPRTIDHAFRDEANECVYNITKLYEQMEHNDLMEENQKYIIGNFEWVNEIDGDVFFAPNPNGRFKVAWLPSAIDGTEGLANRVEQRGDKFYPLNLECVRFGCDPFSLKSTHGEGSKGAIHGKTILIPEGGAPSNEFVIEYIARPQDETIFFEDVIKVIRYYGAPILVESNRIDLLRHMRNRGYRPFAMNRLDKPLNKLNPNELEYGGQTMSGKDILDSHMNGIGVWIEKYVGLSVTEEFRLEGEMGNMPFNETLKDWLKFDPDNRTKYDATISSGLAIMACSTEKYKGVKKERKPKIVNFVKKFNNNGNVGQRIN